MEIRKRIIIVIFALIAGIILVAAGILISVINSAENVEGRIGRIDVLIEDDNAAIDAELDIDTGADVSMSGLRMELDTGEIDARYSEGGIHAVMVESQFRELLDRDIVDLKGNAEVSVFGPIRAKRSLNEKINISFIHEIAESLNVSNVRVNFSFLADTVIEMDLKANVSRDVHLRINNTRARLTSPAGQFDATVIRLDYRTDQGGSAKVSIPPIAALGLALYSREVIIECWGIEARAEIPLFSG